MPEPHNLHRTTTRIMSVLMIVLGVAMLALALAHGAGPTAKGFLLGVLFIAAGAGRLYVLGRMRAGRS
jgi:hypothetical protein